MDMSGALHSAGQAQDHARVRELSEDYAYAQAELEELMAEWEQLSSASDFALSKPEAR